MAIYEQGSNIVVDDSIAGSLFPKTEREIPFPVLIDGTNRSDPLHIEGSVFGKSIEIRGSVRIDGPVVSRGDTKLTPIDGAVMLMSGITVNGILNCLPANSGKAYDLASSVEHASTLIRGDIAVNQSLFLSNAIVFGSIRAVNCKLENCIVLGTVIVEEMLTVTLSSIGGYAAREVVFEGSCMLIHALGESTERPVCVPYETLDGKVIASDIRYYPAIRADYGLTNQSHLDHVTYPIYSRLDEVSDWVAIDAYNKTVIDGSSDLMTKKWVLSIGGRIGDFSAILKSINALAEMLKCGFEFDHYQPKAKIARKNRVLENLNSDEKWIFDKVCEV